MAVDGRVTIALDVQDNTRPVFHKLKENINSLGDGAGDKLERNIRENVDKAARVVKTKASAINEALDKNHEIKVTANTSEASRKITETTGKLKDKKADLKITVSGDADGVIKKTMADTSKLGEKRTTVKMTATGDAIKEVAETEAKTNKLNGKKFKVNMHAQGGDEVQRQTNKVTRGFDKAEKSAHRFRDIVAGTLVGSAIRGGIGMLGQLAKSVAHTGIEFDKTQDTMKTVWSSLTTEAPKDGKAIVGYINQVSSHSIYAADTINRMAQSFYHVHSSREETEKWTKSFVALGSTLHMSNDALAESGEQFAKIVAGGKASSEDMAVMINRFPMFGEALQKATGKSMKQLYAMSAAGKLSAKQFTEALSYLGKKYSGSTKEAMTSFLGMTMYTKSRWQTLTGDIMKSSFKLSKGATTTLTKLLSDDKLKDYAKVISKGFAGVLTVFSKLLSYINKNHKALMNIAQNLIKITGIIGKTVWKTFVDVIGAISSALFGVNKHGKGAESPLKVLEQATTAIAKHPKEVREVTQALLALFAYKKLTTFALGIHHVNSELFRLTKFRVGRGINLFKDMFGKGDGTSIIGKTRKVLSSVKGVAVRAFGGIGKVASKAFSPIARISKRGFSSVVKYAKAMRSGIGTAFSWVARQARSVASSLGRVTRALGRLVMVGVKKAIRGIKALGAAMLANPWTIWVVAIGAVIAILVELYKHNKKFRKFVNGLISWAKKGAKQVVKWFGNMYSGVGRWVSKLVKSVKKRWGNLFKDIRNVVKSFWSYIKAWLSLFTDVFTGKWSRVGKDVKRIVRSLFKVVKGIFRAGYDYLNDATDGKLGKMVNTVKSAGRAIGRAWRATWNGISSFFSNIWKAIKHSAQNGINGVIGVLRGAIGAIDSVIHMFGGKKEAIGKPSYVHLATGTGYRPISRLTNAVLNDGADIAGHGNVEGIVRTNGRIDKVAGRNSRYVLAPNENVLNASEMQAVQAHGIQHFANGTGLLGDVWDAAKWFGNKAKNAVTGSLASVGGWFGDLYKGIKGKAKAVTSFVAHPIKSLEKLLPSSITANGSIMNAIAGMMSKGVSGAAGDWWTQLWSMANSTMTGGDGGSSDLLSAVIKYGKGHKYVWGATGPDVFDCSGLVQYALKKLGVSFPHYSGDQFKASKAVSNPQSGDLVFYGNGGSEHVGVYGGGGRFWSAQSPSAHPNIGWGPVHGFGEKFAGYRRVPGLSSKSSKKDSSKSSNKGLSGLIKSEVGGGFFKWIEKFLSPLFSDDGGDASGGKVSGDLIRKAAREVGVSLNSGDIAHIESVIQHESGGNSRAVNRWDSNAKAGHPSKGVLQFIDSTFQHYALGGHKNIYSAYDQLLAMFNDKTWRRDLTLGGWGPTGGRRKAYNGGIFAGLTDLLVGDDPFNRKEQVINARKPTADALIADAMSDRIKHDPNGMYSRLNQAVGNMRRGYREPQLAVASGNVDTVQGQRNSAQLAKALDKLANVKGGNVYLGTNKVGRVIDSYQSASSKSNNWFQGRKG